MKKETLEEAAENFWRNDETMSDYVQQAYITGFIQGAKWQQEQDREMLKEQIIKAYDESNKRLCLQCTDFKTGIKYYNETFKNETK
jgi:hypothetical protein